MIVDTVNKTIQIQGETLGEIVEQLQAMFPGTWKEYTVSPTSVVVTKEVIREVPIFREIPYQPYYPTAPWNPWEITCGGTLQGCGWHYGWDSVSFGTLSKNEPTTYSASELYRANDIDKNKV